MKNLLFTIALCLLLTGCLSEDPKGQLPEKEAYATAAGVELHLVNNLYNYIGGNQDSQGLMGTPRGVYDFNSLTTDEQMLPIRGGDWYDGGFWQRLHTHQWTASEKPLHNTWNYLYKVVMLCNRSLYKIDRNRNVLTSAQYESYTAEVRAIRAMYYFYIMDLFGRVPLVTNYSETPETTGQTDRSATYAFILNELNAALPNLSMGRSNYVGAYYGRVTKPVVWFLLAKLYLNAEVYADNDWTDAHRPSGSSLFFQVDGHKLNAWQAAIAYCEKLTAAGYSLEADPAKNFSVQNETSAENIFVIPMDKLLYANQFDYLFRSRHYVHGSALGMGAEDGTSATLSTVRAFGYGTENLDTRWAMDFFADTVSVDGKVVMLDNGEPLVYKPLEVLQSLTGSPYEQTAGARMKKYEVDRQAYSDGRLQNNDIVLYRYADVLLMQAEALVRNGDDGSAPFDAVRARAGMPLRSCTLTNLLTERLLELMWEGWRRNDLVRFGEFDTHTYLTVFPIPQSVLDLNGKLTQNKGYK